MMRFTKPRRSLWLGVVIGVVIAGLAATVAVAASDGSPADLTFTPKYATQFTNIDVARAWAKNYYGAPGAPAGPSGGWNAPLNQSSDYADEARSVASKGINYLNARRDVANRAIVLDVDDTTLTTWNYELFSNWDFNPTTNAQFVGLTGSTFTGNMFPATPGMLDLADQAESLGYAIFWITGRGDSQHQVTVANLQSDTAAGLSDLTSVTLTGRRFPRSTPGIRRRLRSTRGTEGSPTACSRSLLSVRTRRTSTRPSSAPRTSRQGPRARLSSTSPEPGPTSSPRGTRSSPTSATSSATCWAASRTRRSRCRTRTTTCRNEARGPLPLRDTRSGSGARSPPMPSELRVPARRPQPQRTPR